MLWGGREMGLYFDRIFSQFLKIGDIEAAIALLTKKYPHLKKDESRQARYLALYSARLDYITATNLGH
jgi:hypothetical protein